MSHPRGNALMVTLIALAVLMLLVAAAIQFTGTNREAAITKARADEVQACAEVGRKMLLAKLRAAGGGASVLPVVDPMQVTLNGKLPDSQTAGQEKEIRTAHFDGTASNAVIVKLDSTVMGSSRYQARDMANTLAQTTLGGSYYRVVVSCKHPSSNAQSEVEFTFRYGL